MEADQCQTALWDSSKVSQVSPGMFWLPLETAEVVGSSLKLLLGSSLNCFVHVRGRSMPVTPHRYLWECVGLYWRKLKSQEAATDYSASRKPKTIVYVLQTPPRQFWHVLIFPGEYMEFGR